MAIDLSDYEAGVPFEGDYVAALGALQTRLAHAQVAHIVHRKRSLVLFEGWDASGKGGIIQRMTRYWDPRAYSVWPIAAPTDDELDHHFLWRFWQRLPGAGRIAVFDRSWYGRVLVERVEALASPTQLQRAYDEINEFESQQLDDGTAVIKIFLHIRQDVQDHRLARRIDDPWKRWKVDPDDFRNRERRGAYLEAIRDMLALTDTRWAPWHVVDANDKKAARIAALTYVVERLEAHVPMNPPEVDSGLLTEARKALGLDG